MTLNAKIPDSFAKEARYILEVMLQDFLGAKVVCVPHDKSIIELSAEGKTLSCNADFFSQSEAWHRLGVKPHMESVFWDSRSANLPIRLMDPLVPILFGKPHAHFDKENIKLDWDLFGSAFFLLTRYEEFFQKKRDNHDRIRLDATVEGRLGFVQRPLVDEYLEILRACLRHLWPIAKTTAPTFGVQVSCDLDHVYCPSASGLKPLLRRMGGELLHYRNFRMLPQYLCNYVSSRSGDHTYDPYYQAVFHMMTVNEDLGNRVCFNVKPLPNHPHFDAPIDLDDPGVRHLLREIHRRGHEIGFHPGYLSYNNKEIFMAELDKLKGVLAEEGIEQEIESGRQHYLRWKAPETTYLWEKAGICCDSTLGFAQSPGFRCGTSRRFRMYDLSERRPMKLHQQPLIVMDGSVIQGDYLGLGRTAEGLRVMKEFKEICRFYGGCFTLLWHNSSLRTKWDQTTYRDLAT